MSFVLLKIIVQWLRRRACNADVRETTSGLVFSATAMKLVYTAFIVVSAALTALVLEFEAVWIAAFPMCFAVGLIAAWPPEIVVTRDALVQHEWWGRTRRIAWADVASILQRSRDGSTLVFAVDGTEIRHSGCHAASHRFQAEIMSRTGIAHLAEWDALPSLAG
jgi:hypothetical protein